MASAATSCLLNQWTHLLLDIQYLIIIFLFSQSCTASEFESCLRLTKTSLQVAQGCNPDFHLPAELLVSENQTFQPDGEPHVTAPNHVLDLEVQELGREPKLLHHACVLSGCEPRLLLAEGRAEGWKQLQLVLFSAVKLEVSLEPPPC